MLEIDNEQAFIDALFNRIARHGTSDTTRQPV